MAIPKVNESGDAKYPKFPDADSSVRLQSYEHNDLLQEGDHFNAFNIEVEGELKKRYGKLRYIVANYAGLVSKISADIMFLDPVKYSTKNTANQQLIEALAFNNRMDVQNYESAVSNSARGDAVYKLRIGKRYETDEKSTIIIENISPYLYFPQLDDMNMQNSPAREELCWKVYFDRKCYIRKEIHSSGIIENEIWSYDSSSKRLTSKLNWTNFYPDEPEVTETRVPRNLIVHVPNWRIGTKYFGISDYVDMDSIFFALNNRITKIDNVLDTHSDPILALPDGLLDEEGEVKRENLQLIEIPGDANGAKPEYIVWNANLEAAFKQLDEIVKFAHMFTETSPDALGLGEGNAESGRALKFKLLRTLAKVKRKQLYYGQALKEVMTLAQELSIKWPEAEILMDGKPVPRISQVETPEVTFSDRYVYDSLEAAQEEQIRLTSGNTTVKDSIQRLDQVDDKMAEEKAKEIEEEKGLNLPMTEGFQAPGAQAKQDEQKNNTQDTKPVPNER